MQTRPDHEVAAPTQDPTPGATPDPSPAAPKPEEAASETAPEASPEETNPETAAEPAAAETAPEAPVEAAAEETPAEEVAPEPPAEAAAEKAPAREVPAPAEVAAAAELNGESKAAEGTPGEPGKLAELLDEPSEKARGAATPKKGSRVTGTIVRITDDGVFVDFGGREEGVLDPREIQDDKGAATHEVGARIQATVTGVEGGIKLSTKGKSGRKPGNVPALLEASKSGLSVSGKVVGVNKGGLVVYAMGVRAFCPFSQIDRRYVENPESFVGQKLSFKVASMDEKGKNVVLSRRVLLEDEAKQEGAKLRETLSVGMELTGTVARLRPFGAFVDVGGIDGLVHVSEISHRRVKDPSEVLKVGQEVRVQVVKIDDLNGASERISLSLKKLETDPWDELASKLEEGQKVRGKVVRLVDFGAFIEVAPGVDGLAHVSTLAEGRVEHPSDVVTKGEEVDAWVVSVETSARRVSLSLVDPAGLPARGGGGGGGGGGGRSGRRDRGPREPREEMRTTAGTPGMTSMEEAFERLREQQQSE
jgi:small subunit ribosomal protein S1